MERFSPIDFLRTGPALSFRGSPGNLATPGRYAKNALHYRACLGERDLKPIIDRFSEPLPASDVPLRRLYRRVTEQELNLFEFASSAMTEAGTSAAKIMRVRDGQCRFVWHIVLLRTKQHQLLLQRSAPHGVFQIRLKTLPSITRESRSQTSIRSLHQSGTGTVRSRPPLPTKSTMTQWSSLIAVDPVARPRLPIAANRTRAAVQSRLRPSCRARCFEQWHLTNLGPDHQIANCQSFGRVA